MTLVRRLALDPVLCFLCHRELGAYVRWDGKLIGSGCIGRAMTQARP